jgi:L-alanine-DL-glutamate epimerase-like enolase superfamily enzyme
MEITDVVVHTLSLPTVEAERADGTQDAAIVEVETDAGITGIGEADSSPAVVDAVVNAPVSHEMSAGLKTVVLGQDPFENEVIWDEMFERSYFYGRKGAAITAMSAIDMACWDIVGKATGKPIHQLLGGKHRDSVRAYASTLFPSDPTDTEHVREEARRAREQGFTAIKYGWGGFGEDRRRDRELVAAARDELGPGVDLMVDAGFAFEGDVGGGRKRIAELDAAHDLFWVEEPVRAHDLGGYRRLSEACETRIVGGEEEYTVHGFADFLRRGEPDGVQPDVARAGGITQLDQIASRAAAAGVPCYPHGFSTDVVVAANLQLVAANPNAPLLEYCVADSPLRWGVTEEAFPVVDGRVAIPDEPGLGITLDRDTLAEYRTDY